MSHTATANTSNDLLGTNFPVSSRPSPLAILAKPLPRFRSAEKSSLFMKMMRILGLLAVAGLMTLLPACGRSGKTQVAFVTNNNADFWTYAENELANRDGWEINL